MRIFSKVEDKPVITFTLENDEYLSSNMSINNIPSTFLSLDEGDYSILSNLRVKKNGYDNEVTKSIVNNIDQYLTID